MAYGFDHAGRVSEEGSGAGRLLSFDQVEARLVEAVELHRRTQSGRWPFASDGPWHLIRKEWSDWDARDAKPMPRIPLSTAEATRMREALAWLLLVQDDADRVLIVAAVTELAKGAAMVPWVEVRSKLGLPISRQGVAGRYGRAMTALTRAVNRAAAARAA